MPTIPWTAGPAAGHSGEVTVMASEFKLRRLSQVPGFLRASLVIRKQALATAGAVGTSLRAAPLRRTFWTLSAWESRPALEALVGAEPHRSTMKRMRPAMEASVFTFWTTTGDRLPDWAEADRRIEARRNGTA
ncbi:DUF3291 domain-containing protein [Kitasatospora terrestris]|uniref:DUF3291 domain-containing protein n=1 Tax=Kitasatospora terrestris TaxID=258051 RepID=A0ABP9DMT0_9ACTN